MDILTLKVFGNVTVMMLIAGVVGLFVIAWLWRKLKGLLKSQTPGTYESRMRCPDCHWVGVVSTLKPLCKKCGNTQLRKAG